VQPKSTAKATQGMLTIQPDVADLSSQTFFANVSVAGTPAPMQARSSPPIAGAKK
jgi:hypothetical protein